jgi:hypothetical protein
MAFYSSTIFQEAGNSVKQSLLASFGFVRWQMWNKIFWFKLILRSGTRHIRLRISRNLDHGQIWQARTATQHISSNGLVFAGGRILFSDT